MIALMIINAKKKKKKPPVFSLEVNKLNKEGRRITLMPILRNRVYQLNQMKTFWFHGI